MTISLAVLAGMTSTIRAGADVVAAAGVAVVGGGLLDRPVGWRIGSISGSPAQLAAPTRQLLWAGDGGHQGDEHFPSSE